MTFATLVDAIVSFIDSYILPLLYALALFFFVWGVYRYFMSAGDEDKRKKGRAFAVWGLIGLLIIASVWGIVTMLVGFLSSGV